MRSQLSQRPAHADHHDLRRAVSRSSADSIVTGGAMSSPTSGSNQSDSCGWSRICFVMTRVERDMVETSDEPMLGGNTCLPP